MTMSSEARDILRPPSEQLVDLHVYLVPVDQWRDHTRSVISKLVDESVSVGFVRVLPEANLYSLREEIYLQLGDEIRLHYNFLRGVGRHLAKIRPKQEFLLKIKSFLPPHTYSPEIFIVEANNDLTTSFPSSEISSTRSDHLDGYTLPLNLHRNDRKEFPSQRSIIPPIGKVTLGTQAGDTDTPSRTDFTPCTDRLPNGTDIPRNVGHLSDDVTVPKQTQTSPLEIRSLHDVTSHRATPRAPGKPSASRGFADFSCQAAPSEPSNQALVVAVRRSPTEAHPLSSMAVLPQIAQYGDETAMHRRINREHRQRPPPHTSRHYSPLADDQRRVSRAITPLPSQELRMEVACQTLVVTYDDGLHGDEQRHSRGSHRGRHGNGTVEHGERDVTHRDVDSHHHHHHQQRVQFNGHDKLRTPDSWKHRARFSPYPSSRHTPPQNTAELPWQPQSDDDDARAQMGSYDDYGRPPAQQRQLPAVHDIGRGGQRRTPREFGDEYDGEQPPPASPYARDNNAGMAELERRRAKELYRQEMQQLENEEHRQVALLAEGEHDGRQGEPPDDSGRRPTSTDDEKWPGANMREEWPTGNGDDGDEGRRAGREGEEGGRGEVAAEDETRRAGESEERGDGAQRRGDGMPTRHDDGRPPSDANPNPLTGNNSSEKERLLKELRQVKGDRIFVERQREELVKRAKELQVRSNETRDQARSVWKQQYFVEKKRATALEDEAQQMQRELEGLHRRLMSQMETGSRGSGPLTNNKPSQQSNLLIQATRLRHDLDALERKSETIKMKLDAEIKLKDQAEIELKALRSGIVHHKINARLARSKNAQQSTTQIVAKP